MVLTCAILHNFIQQSNPVHPEDNHIPVNLENSNDLDMMSLPKNINDTNEGITSFLLFFAQLQFALTPTWF